MNYELLRGVYVEYLQSKVLQNDHLTIRSHHHLSRTPQIVLVQLEFSLFDKNHPLVVTTLLLLLWMIIPVHGLALSPVSVTLSTISSFRQFLTSRIMSLLYSYVG